MRARRTDFVGVVPLGAAVLSVLVSCSNSNCTRPSRQSEATGPEPGHVTMSPQNPSTVLFSGYEWWIKSSQIPVGPGPNVFHDDNVTVDGSGRLHLRISHRNGRWTSAEVVVQRSLGYGTYRFYVHTPDDLDPRAVLGLFTWDAAALDHSYREIDIEISRWGDPAAPNAQFVVQPYTKQGHLHRFELPRGQAIHEFTWSPRSVSFATWLLDGGSDSSSRVIISRHLVTDGVPEAGGESARMNLWLVAGQPPANGADVEMIIERFEFVPVER